MSDAAEHIGGIVAGDVVWGINVAAPRAAMLPIIRFTLGGGGGGGTIFPPGPNVESARRRGRPISKRSQHCESSSIKMCQYPAGPTGYERSQMERWRFLSAVGSRNREQYQLHHSTFKVVNIWRRRRSKEKGKEQTSWSYW